MGEVKRLPVSIGEVLNALSNYAKSYHKHNKESVENGTEIGVLRNKHMNELGPDVKYIPPELVDAVVVDFINYIGSCCGVDYAMYTSDVK